MKYFAICQYIIYLFSAVNLFTYISLNIKDEKAVKVTKVDRIPLADRKSTSTLIRSFYFCAGGIPSTNVFKIKLSFKCTIYC